MKTPELYKIKTYPLKENSISYIYSIRDKIEIAPDYQRQGELWTNYKKQLFLDSIFNGYDIPKMYFHVLKKPKKIRKKVFLYTLIDGRQRLETLWGFIDNDFPLEDLRIEYRNEIVDLSGMYYKDLAKNYPTQVHFFDDYPLPIIGVETKDDDLDLVEDLFSRLNEAVSINAAEKRNAMGGNMVKLIRKIALHTFFKQKVSISNKRYQHYEVSVRLLFLEHCLENKKIVDTKKAYLDNFVKEFKGKNPEPEVRKNVKSVLDIMSKRFSNKDNLLKSQGRIPIYYLLFREGNTQGKLGNISRQKIIEFNKKVEINKKKAQADITSARADLLEYDRLTIQGTNDASSIRTRFQIIAKEFHIDSSKIVESET